MSVDYWSLVNRPYMNDASALDTQSLAANFAEAGVALPTGSGAGDDAPGHLLIEWGEDDDMRVRLCALPEDALSAELRAAFATGGQVRGYAFDEIMMGGAEGTAADITIQANEILTLKKHLTKIVASHTGQSEERIAKDTDRDNFMSAEEAKEYGLVDEVIVGLKDTEEEKKE